MNRLHLILTAALCATPLSVALPSSAAAQQAESVQITVRVIVASASGAPDAALQSVAARLQAQFPEFSGFAQHSTTPSPSVPAKSSESRFPAAATPRSGISASKRASIVLMSRFPADPPRSACPHQACSLWAAPPCPPERSS